MSTNVPLQEIETPFMVVNQKKVLANCRSMLRYCISNGLTLRPHMKTHKCLEAAFMMTEGIENRPITVSTIAEAEFFVKNGFKDILFAHLPVFKKQFTRLHALMESPYEAIIHVFCDNTSGLDILERNAPPVARGKWSVFLKVDCGYGRGGATFNESSTVELAHKIASGPATILKGLYAHDGNSYYEKSPEGASEVGILCCARLLEVASKIGIKGLEIGFGSSPSCLSLSGKNIPLPKGIVRISPGAYVFCDTQQAGIGGCTFENIACRVATRVIGHYPLKGHMLVDAGFTALSSDLGPIVAESLSDPDLQTPRLSAAIAGHPELVLTRVTQELGYIKAARKSDKLDFSKYPIGSMLFIYPYHCCATADKFPFYFVTVDDENTTDKWVPVKGW